MKIMTSMTLLAFCLIAPLSSVAASEQGTAPRAASAAPMILAQDETPCQKKCSANHQICKAQKKNNCYTIMQNCWNRCAGR